jgi:hypothetical protein
MENLKMKRKMEKINLFFMDGISTWVLKQNMLSKCSIEVNP